MSEDNVAKFPQAEFYLSLSQGLTARGVKGAMTGVPDNAEIDHIRLDHGNFTLVFRRNPPPKQ